tara:strand:+ start:1530 stop:1694 length:165 start_codon:yes stop_codon:yes gene_type:complete
MSVENLVNHLKGGDNVKASQEFEGVLGQKISDALDAKKIELASTLIQRNKEEQE